MYGPQARHASRHHNASIHPSWAHLCSYKSLLEHKSKTLSGLHYYSPANSKLTSTGLLQIVASSAFSRSLPLPHRPRSLRLDGGGSEGTGDRNTATSLANHPTTYLDYLANNPTTYLDYMPDGLHYLPHLPRHRQKSSPPTRILPYHLCGASA